MQYNTKFSNVFELKLEKIKVDSTMKTSLRLKMDEKVGGEKKAKIEIINVVEI